MNNDQDDQPRTTTEAIMETLIAVVIIVITVASVLDLLGLLGEK